MMMRHTMLMGLLVYILCPLYAVEKTFTGFPAIHVIEMTMEGIPLYYGVEYDLSMNDGAENDTVFIGAFLEYNASYQDDVKGKLTIPGKVHGAHLDRLSPNVFENCLSLICVVLPEVERANDHPDNAKYSVDYEAFSGCVNLETIILPKCVISLGNYCFKGCDKLRKIYSNCENPFGISSVAFDDTVKENCILYVPAGTRQIYEERGWDFAHIVEMGEGEGIEEIVDTGRKAEDAVYDLQGRRVDSSMFNTQVSAREKGVYIRGGKKYMK